MSFFSISILLHDLFTFFSFYKILKNSNCGALLFCVFYTCAKNIVVLIIWFQEKLIQNWILLFHSQFIWNNPSPYFSYDIYTSSNKYQFERLQKEPPYGKTNINAVITREFAIKAVSWKRWRFRSVLPGPLPRRIEPAGSCRSNEEFEEFFALDMTIWNLQLKTLQQKVCVTQNIQEYYM